MSKEYPNLCCRCGFCCLSKQCPASVFEFGEIIDGICPALTFQEADINIIEAKCNLPKLVSFGDGCCMKTRCFENGIVYDFASLPPFVKILMAQALRKHP